MRKSFTSGTRLSLALLWLALLLFAGWAISRQLELTGDLRKFMPQAQTPAQKLLIDELGEGPGSRLLLVALSGGDAETLATQSAALRDKLTLQSHFKLIANGGESGLDAIPGQLRPYRYLLSSTLDTQAFDRKFLAMQSSINRTARQELETALGDTHNGYVSEFGYDTTTVLRYYANKSDRLQVYLGLYIGTPPQLPSPTWSPPGY